MGILDTIIHTKHQDSFQQFKPNEIVEGILVRLKDRERAILAHRYGLQGKEIKTLAAIGKEMNLTRERVRQIEKDLIRNTRKSRDENKSFGDVKRLFTNLIIEHGGIISEENLLQALGANSPEEKNSIVFILHLIEELEKYLHSNYKTCWVTVLFNKQLLDEFINYSKKIVSDVKKPMTHDQFLELVKNSELYKKYQQELTDKILLNFLDLAPGIEKNVFDKWGLETWKEIKPKDVGDKAYLVLKQHGKPEHYSVITEIINKSGFDNRTAYKETVHNELIKDSRFILIGRGIYALSEWGYKPGVVADVITEVLKNSQSPISRDKIIEEVLKNRQVKKNTIIVGLSNKKLFKKVGKNLYSLASQ